ncbi:UNKNOWN [Stylonychia lemnae]|uniref:Uncharacterized protein n=1 Tax=Stylonychia lemnae TaxID=5949 RepID=A0A078A3R5_STYLE|nr:UNKNOWN [Stylonychia lemnae]|eukprot:CDW76893.1 UNKNOWN [Stylonychia lemnae]
MRNNIYLSIFAILLGIIQSVKIELSKENIVQRLQKDSGFFQRHINDKLKQLNRQDNLVSLDYSTLQIEDPQDSKQKAIKFTIQGSASYESFTAVVHQKLQPSQPWESYKNRLQNEVEIIGIEDEALRNDMTVVVSRLAHIFSDWTNNAMWGSAEQFYSSHLAMYLFVRDSDYFYTNGQSFFYVHDDNPEKYRLTEENQAQLNYYKNAPQPKSPRYFGLTLNDQYLKRMFFTFSSKEKDFDLLSRLRFHRILFPELNSLNVFWLSAIFPKLEMLYDQTRKANINLNPKDAYLNWVDSALANFKIEFKQDHVDLNIPLIFDITVQNNQNGWDVFRKCFLEIAVNIDIKQLEGQAFKFEINGLPAGVSKIMIVDPKSPSEHIEDEQVIVKGLVNLLVRRFFRQLTTSPLQLPVKFPRFDIENVSRNFKLNVVPGYLDFGIESLDLTQIPNYGFNLVSMAGPISEGYNREEQIKKDAYTRQQEINRRYAEHQEALLRIEEERKRNEDLAKQVEEERRRLDEADRRREQEIEQEAEPVQANNAISEDL